MTTPATPSADRSPVPIPVKAQVRVRSAMAFFAQTSSTRRLPSAAAAINLAGPEHRRSGSIEDGSHQPAHEKPDRSDANADQHEHRGNEPRRTVDRLHESDPPGLLRHSATDQRDDARQGPTGRAARSR